MMVGMRTFFQSLVLGSILLAGCGDSGTGGSGGDGGAGGAGGAGASGGSGGSGGSGATGGTGGTGGSIDYTADIETFCTNVDICWDDADPCDVTISGAIAETPGCDAELAVMFSCVEDYGVYADGDCEGDPAVCEDEVTAAYECLGVK